MVGEYPAAAVTNPASLLDDVDIPLQRLSGPEQS
jgi:hypothetical protein